MSNDNGREHRRFNRKGFTLIELIIVIFIIGILASIAAPMIGSVKVKTVCGEAVTYLATIRTALTSYYVECGVYPDVKKRVVQTDIGCFPGLVSFDDLTGTYFGKECYAIERAYRY